MVGVRDKYYFVADVHLRPHSSDGAEVEERFLSFLRSLGSDTRALYLLGDIFDFWYEYKSVIPRGYTRVLGRLAELADSGVEVFLFKGNHDVWLYSFFQEEIGAKVLEQPYLVEIEGKWFCLGHGDGLGSTNASFRFARWCFHNRFLQSILSAIHPRWGLAMGYLWSDHSRRSKSDTPFLFSGAGEPIVDFALSFGEKALKDALPVPDIYVFGHLHKPVAFPLSDRSMLYILGEWSHGCEYLRFDGVRAELLSYR